MVTRVLRCHYIRSATEHTLDKKLCNGTTVDTVILDLANGVSIKRFGLLLSHRDC